MHSYVFSGCPEYDNWEREVGYVGGRKKRSENTMTCFHCTQNIEYENPTLISNQSSLVECKKGDGLTYNEGVVKDGCSACIKYSHGIGKKKVTYRQCAMNDIPGEYCDHGYGDRFSVSFLNKCSK